MTLQLLQQKPITVDDAALEQMRADAYDASKVFVDSGKHVYLVATRKGGITIAAPITVRLGWREFMQLVLQLVTQSLGFRADA